MNEMLFPAAFLQPPFFDPNADDALNYGSLGTTIGHELTHGFDDQGGKYDEYGNLHNWWTVEDSLRFYFLGSNWRKRVEHIGAKESIDQEGPLIV